MNSNPLSWDVLLGGSHQAKPDKRAFYLLKRQRHELLAVPVNRRNAAEALTLYLPQTSKARWAKTIFRLALSGPLAGLLPSREVDLERTEFTDFLGSLSDNRVPDFCVLSGNPAEPGRRFLFGLLDEKGRCYRVVKCATDPVGRELIDHEAAVLNSTGEKIPGIPEVRAALSTCDCSAFAMDFFPAPTHPLARKDRIGLVRRWIRPGPAVSLDSLPPWRAIADSGIDGSGTMIKPVIFHGDFAPWNIRGDGKEWMVVDWEKACPLGPPLWDLLHYEIQTAILVDRSSPENILERLAGILADADIHSYLQDCGCPDAGRLLVDSYLRHADKHFPPIRGRDTMDRLLTLWRHERDREYICARQPTEPAPDFTIVTPSFNQLALLRLCVASVRDQIEGSDASLEHLIHDAGSTGIDLFAGECRKDQTPQERPNYRCAVTQEADQGMYDAINRGFRRADGKIVAWLNSDEQYLPGVLQKVKDFFASHPDVDVLFGDALVADEKGEVVAYRRTVSPSILHTQLAQLGTFSCATFVRRRILEQGILPDPSLKAIADAKWIAEMKRSGVRMAVLPEPLAVFMVTTSNLGQSSIAHLEMMRWRKQAGPIGELLRGPVIVLHRIRKFFAGAYRSHAVSSALYRPSSPEARASFHANHISHAWPGDRNSNASLSRSSWTQVIRIAGAGLLFPLVYSFAVHWLDGLATGVTLTPFFSIVCLLGMAFFLPPVVVALAAVVFSASSLLSFLGFANLLAQETIGGHFVAIRFASFLAASLGSVMLSIYRQRAGQAQKLNADILNSMAVPLVTSDAAGLITFANAQALALLKASDKRIIGEKWTKLMMANQDEGTATRYYLSLFANTAAGKKTARLHLMAAPQEPVRAGLTCFGEGKDRVLMTTLSPKADPELG
jgi:hypothetical protein